MSYPPGCRNSKALARRQQKFFCVILLLFFQSITQKTSDSVRATMLFLLHIRYNWQHHIRWVLAVVQDRLVRYRQFSIGAKVMTGIGIAVPAREIAACHIQADTMPRLEDIARRPQIYLILVGFARFDQRRRLSLGEIAIASAD